MKEDIQFLKELQEELKSQDNDAQAAPRFWSVMDYKWYVTGEGFHERVSVYFPDAAYGTTIEDYVDQILKGESDNDYTEEQIAELKELHEWESDDDVLAWIHENDSEDCYLVYEKEDSFVVPDTMFLTKAEAKRHIELNKHHYTSQVHTYAMTAWRAPKVERLLNILENFDWDRLITETEDSK